MFEQVKEMSHGLFQDMMKEFKTDMDKKRLGSVNFGIEKKLDDGKTLRANSYNPLMLLYAFNEFEKEAKKYGGKK